MTWDWDNLAGEQLEQIHHALLSAFPDPAELRSFLKFKLDLELDQIATGNLRNLVYELIGWTQAHGRLRELCQRARMCNLGNALLSKLDSSANESQLDGTLGRAVSSQTPSGGSSSDPVVNAQPRECRALESILDVLSTRRAFFQGDEQIIDDAAAFQAHAEHLWKMLCYLDAGRAMSVTNSFVESVDEMRDALAELSSVRQGPIKERLSRVIVACKDYVDRRHLKGMPHIGRGQRIEDFDHAVDELGFSSTDSFETFITLLEYLSRSCADLLEVRNKTLDLVGCIATTEPPLSARCAELRTSIANGNEQLITSKADLDRTAGVVREVLAVESRFVARRTKLSERAKHENPAVRRLVSAIAEVKSPRAWTQRTPATTIVKVEHLGAYRLRIRFADRSTRELELGSDWEVFYGAPIDIKQFREFSLNSKENTLTWSTGVRMTGEGLRSIADESA